MPNYSNCRPYVFISTIDWGEKLVAVWIILIIFRQSLILNLENKTSFLTWLWVQEKDIEGVTNSKLSLSTDHDLAMG